MSRRKGLLFVQGAQGRIGGDRLRARLYMDHARPVEGQGLAELGLDVIALANGHNMRAEGSCPLAEIWISEIGARHPLREKSLLVLPDRAIGPIVRNNDLRL